MQHKKQVVLNVLTIVALLLATIGLVPVAASNAGIKSAPAAQSTSVQAAPTGEEPTEGFSTIRPKNGVTSGGEEGVVEGNPLDRDDAFYSRRTAHDPSVNFTLGDAAVLRAQAATQLSGQLQNQPAKPASPLVYGGAWTSVGPNPMVLTDRGDGSFDAMAGRIGALAIRSSAPYTMYLGGAQGGVWTMASPYTGTWTPRTDFIGSLAIGAIALAPSNEDIVYVGTGEGALSGDSYFGNGVLKSVDGGTNFSHISAAGYFTKVSISKIVVDPTDPNTLYAGTLRGRGGNRRTSPPDASSFGVWKSIDGGVNWTEVLTATTNPLDFAGVTDMVLDPQNPQVIYASMLGVGISKTVDGGVTWTSAMNGLPAGNFATAPTRFSLGLSRPTVGVSATLYTGFEYYTGATRVASSVWKSTNDANSWSATSTAVIGDYCGSQCFYDNLIGVDPISPTIVYALGLYNYNTGSGGIYRSMDSGATWVDLGFNLHPDYHAIAIRNDDPSIVVMGNDGGAWWSSSRGGRLTAGDPITATTWNNLNGLVNPATSATIFRSGLALGQFGSVVANPAVANRFYGGLQDNGTQRKTTGSSTWSDVASGDGGQVLLDPTDANYFYGTYYGISPYRFVDGGTLYVGGTSNEYIDGGINLHDRSEFYIPWMMDPANPERLYLGTYRVYRTDNAKAAKSADVFWNTISPDLTSGCTGAAPNGGRGCVITAFGKSAGSPALYVGNMEGWIWTTADSTVATPTWVRRDISGTTPMRPVSAFAVDRSNYRTAYVAFSGFDPATPATPGHVFKTTDGGQTWTNITNNLPDIPLNSIDVDPSEPNTLYVGSDIGPYISTDNGATWNPLGSGFPIVTVHQMALNAFTRQLVAATHGRGVWALTDNATQLPALQISKSTPGTPIGPGTPLQYNVTIQNYGNITATNVVITDPIPANTSFVAAGSGGALVGSNVVWTVPSVAMPSVVHTDPSTWPTNTLPVGLQPGSTTVTFTVFITNGGGLTSGSVITNDGYLAKSAEGPGAVGSPYYMTLSPANAVLVTPDSQLDGTRNGQSITYTIDIENRGFNADVYQLSKTGNAWPTTLWNAAFTAQITQTASVAPGAITTIGVKVDVPAAALNNATDDVTVTVKSTGNAAVSGVATIETIAVTNQILLVAEDGHAPDVSSYYMAALTAAGFSNYNFWDLTTDPVLPLNYMKAHKAIVWFTGTSYPAPLGPYETNLTAFLGNGGRLFMSGQDILDQAAGTTAFVHDYLHVAWDGSETLNDIGTFTVTGVLTNPVTGGIGSLPISYAALPGFSDYADAFHLVSPAQAAFYGIYGKPAAAGLPDGLSVDPGTYKVVFLGFPLEAMGTAGDRSNLISSALLWFGVPQPDLWVQKTGPATAKVGDIVTYTITYGNNSASTAANAWITDTVLAGTTPITQFVISLGTVPAAPFSTTLVYTLPVLPVYAGITFTNQAKINTTDVDANPANNTALAQTFVGAPPVAAFTPSAATAKIVNMSVSFTNASVGTPPLTYLWNFGDGSATTTTVNTTHVYTHTGVFTVTLTASSPWGPNSTYSVAITIKPYTNYLPLIIRQ